MSVVEDSQVNIAETRRVGYHLDLEDFVALDLESNYQEQTSTRGNNNSYGPVHQGRLCEPGGTAL